MCLASLGLGSLLGGGKAETVHTVETIRIPVTDIKTETVRVPGPSTVPAACMKIIAASEQQQQGYRKLSATLAELSRIIDDTGKVVYTKDPNEVVRLSNRWQQLQREQSAAWQLIGTADADITAASPNCPR